VAEPAEEPDDDTKGENRDLIHVDSPPLVSFTVTKYQTHAFLKPFRM